MNRSPLLVGTSCGILILGLAANVSRAAWDQKKPVPKASEIDADALQLAARAAIACGVDYLLSKGETNHMGYLYEPILRKKVVGYGKTEEFEVRFREQVFDEPVYEYEYEQYEDFAVHQGASVDRRTMGKVKRQRIVGRKQVGTRKVTRLVGDPNGPIVHKQTRQLDPIFEGAPDEWPAAFLGQNALALLALLKAGVPQTHPVVSNLAETMTRLLAIYGLPDTTWDVAWVAAALANLGDEAIMRPSVLTDFRRVREMAIQRVLNGQITEGPARGLWGPVCIHTTLLAAMVAYEDSLNQELARRKEQVKLHPDSKPREKKVQEAEEVLSKFVELYPSVTQQGLRFEAVTQAYSCAPNGWTEPIIMQGLPYSIYKLTLGDLGCTAVALYAIRQAAENGRLPDETFRPEVAKGQAVLPAEKVSAVLARAAAAIAALQKPNGTWDAGNVLQPVNDFQPLGMPQLDPKGQVALASTQTLASAAQALAGLMDTGRAVGLEKLLGRYAQNVSAGQTAVRAAAESYLEQKLQYPVGGAVEPFEFLFSLSGVHRALGGPEEDRRDVWSRAAFALVHLQNPDGSWNRGRANWRSSSLRAYQEAAARQAYEDQQAKLPAEQRKPFSAATCPAAFAYGPYDYLGAEVVSTAFAMLFLTDGVRPPVGAFIDPSGGGKCPELLRKTVEVISAREGVKASYMRVRSEAAPSELHGLPMVVLGDAGTLAAPGVADKLRDYLRFGGLIVVESTGATAASPMEARLLSFVQDGRVQAVAPTSKLLAGFKGALPPLRGIFDPGDRPYVLFLTTGAPAASPVAAGAPAAAAAAPNLSQAVQVLYLLTKYLAGSEFFDKAYPSTIQGEDKFVARLDALNRLSFGDAAPPALALPAGTSTSAAPSKAGTPTPPKGDEAGELPSLPKVKPKATRKDEIW